MTIHDELRHVLQRAANMSRLARSVTEHLAHEQAEEADAAWGETLPEGDRIDRSDCSVEQPDPDPEQAPAVDYSDPTARAALSARFARYAHHERQIVEAIRGVHRAFDHAERVFVSVLSGKAAEDAEPRCPGWNEELRARLGGCGKKLERWRDAQGVEQIRSTYLCHGCRRAEERAKVEAA